MRFKYLKLFVLSGLSACTSIYNDDFDCGPGKGVNCKSISQVYAMVNTGQVGQEPLTDESSKDLDSNSKHKKDSQESLPYFSEITPSSIDAKIKHVTRNPEKTIRIWIAPHLDESGSYVSDSYLFTVIEPGKWIEKPKASTLLRNQ